MQIGLESRHFGKGQLILRHQGVLIAASNPRAGDLAIVH
jgi:hypothetical protein